MKRIKTFVLTMPFLFGSFSSFAQTNSVRDSAASTKNNTSKANGTNTAVGALNMVASGVAFSQCPPTNYGYCALGAVLLLMGMQNMKQAKADGDTSGQAAGTQAMTDASLGGGYDPNSTTNALTRDPDIAAGMAFGTSRTDADPQSGFSYDPKTNTVTTKDGKTYTASDVSSPSAMAAAGLSKSLIDSVVAAEKKIEAKANAKLDKYGLNGKAVIGEESGSGGGGGSGGHGGSGGGTPDIAYGGPRAPKLGVNRDPAQVAGMQKDFNGEPIGVAGDSIFRMMTRRYKVKESQSSFLDEAAVLQK